MPDAAGRSVLDPVWVDTLQRDLQHTRVCVDEPMSLHTSFRIGGPADLLLLPTTVQDVQTIIARVNDAALPLTVIGNGSNLLVRDGGLRGVVLKIAENLSRLTFSGKQATVQSGAPLAAVSRAAAPRSLGGLEFACGIPGAIGGGVMMNAGAYQGELKDVVTRVSVVLPDGQLRHLVAAELQFGYRKSLLQERPWIVTEIEMELIPREPERILAQMAHNQYLRESMQPLEWASAGSVFKRPPGHYVGPMIQELGLKGFRVGDAQISEKHAGFIINRGVAKAADVLAVIQHVRERVMERFQVSLETEVRIIGEPPVAA